MKFTRILLIHVTCIAGIVITIAQAIRRKAITDETIIFLLALVLLLVIWPHHERAEAKKVECKNCGQMYLKKQPEVK